MKNFNSGNTQRSFTKSLSLQVQKSESHKPIFKKKGETSMNAKNLRSAPIVSLLIILFLFSFTGCNDSNITGVSENDSKVSGAGESVKGNIYDSTLIRLDLSLKFKSEGISESKTLESNVGNRFNNIISISRDLKPNEELDLQELQPYGIFGLYLSSTGCFTLSNSDGMSFSSKSVLMEKCSFIDLKLRNHEQTSIHVSGFVAGE